MGVGGTTGRARGQPLAELSLSLLKAMPELDSGVLLFGRNVHVHASHS